MSKICQLNRLTILQLLQAPAFYAEVPAYLFMESLGLETAQQVLIRQADQVPEQRAQSQYAADVAIETFGRHTVKLQARSQEHFQDNRLLIPLAEYIASVLGYRPEKFVMRVAKDGRLQDLEF